MVQLIGYFNLDPNRVLDLILEAFETNISQLALESSSSGALVNEEVLQNI